MTCRIRWALSAGVATVMVAVASFQKTAPVVAEEEGSMLLHCTPRPFWVCVYGTSPPTILINPVSH